MKKFIITALFFTLFASTQSFAQRGSSEITINTENIQKTLVGNWAVTSIQPNDADVLIQDIAIKGAGYGEVMKKKADGTFAPVICKIYAQNNSEIMFSDAEGYRVVYKVVSLTKSTMQLRNGATTVNYKKN
jgi:hypothetical protein